MDMQTTRPKGLAKIWREIKRPCARYFATSAKTGAQKNYNERLTADQWGALHKVQVEGVVKRIAPMGQDVYNPWRKPGESGHHTRLALQGRNNV